MSTTAADRFAARLGAIALKRFINASLTPAGGSAIVGVLRDDPFEAPVGIGMQARRLEFACAITAAAPLVEGAAVTLTRKAVTSACVVAERLPDDPGLGHAVVVLRRAA